MSFQSRASRLLRGGAPAVGLILATALLPASAQSHWSPGAGGSGLTGAGALGWGGGAVLQQDVDAVIDLPRIGHRPCVKGVAGPFRCHMADLMTFLPIGEMGGGPGSIYGGAGNDVWGWTDPETGAEWVIAGRSNGTSFIDMRDPTNPVFVANLPAHGVTELHSDMKVYKNHAFIVKDGPDNGIQVFDLTRLRDIDRDDAPVTVDADAVYEEISNAHDIAINEDTGFAYAVGATGGAIGELPNLVTIDAPSSAAGSYQARGANFGPAPDAAGVSGDVVLVNDGVETATDGCQPLAGFTAGSIALVDRGSCNYVVKAANAQAAGAVAMIVVNNVGGGPVTMGGSDPSITIPSVMVSRDDGNTIKAGLPASGTVSSNPEANPCDGGGLHMVDIREPQNPTFAGCFDDDGYTHDAQCVVYRGPDTRYRGRELCFAANPSSPGVVDALTIVDVTDKSNPVLVGKVFEGEPNTYSHQGWLTPDQRYFLHDDESDNGASSAAIPGRTRSRVFDVRDLTQPSLQSVYHGETRAPAHNLYTRGRYMYNANYIDGLRVVDITKIDRPGEEFAPETPSAPDHQGLREVACFDTDPFRDDTGVFTSPTRRTAWGGSWSSYPYFKSGVVVVSGFDGLFLVKPRLGVTGASPPAAGTPPSGDPGVDSRAAACLPAG
jgi:choice-of-anchor B domain-containing protein